MSTPIWTPPQEPGLPPAEPQKKSWPARHKVASGFIALGVVLVALVAIGVGAGPSPAPAPISGTVSSTPATPVAAPSTAPAPAPIPTGPLSLNLGETAVITQNGQNAAHVQITRVTVSTQPADPEFGSPPANGYFVVVHIRARALDNYSGGFDINPLDFYAKVGHQHFEEGNGNSFDALPMAQNEMDAVTLNAGENTSGVIVFDLPSAHGKIAYSPNYEGGPLGFWKF